MYSCQQVLQALSDYIDDDLDLEIRRELEAHMAECRNCVALYDSTRKTVRVVTESRSFDLPQSLSDTLVKKIMARLRES